MHSFFENSCAIPCFRGFLSGVLSFSFTARRLCFLRPVHAKLIAVLTHYCYCIPGATPIGLSTLLESSSPDYINQYWLLCCLDIPDAITIGLFILSESSPLDNRYEYWFSVINTYQMPSLSAYPYSQNLFHLIIDINVGSLLLIHTRCHHHWLIHALRIFST